MPQYRFQARHSSGQLQAGTLAAESAGAAAAILRNQGHHVLQLAPVRINSAQIGNKLTAILNYSSGPTQKDRFHAEEDPSHRNATPSAGGAD